jgi:predicted RND superfamily exporter protein
LAQRLTTLYRQLILGRPALSLALIGMLVLLASLGLPKLRLDASADALTLESDQALDYFREISSRYNTGDVIVVTYTVEGDLFSDESLATLKSLRDELGQVDRVRSVFSILDVPLLYSPKLSFTELSGDFPKLLDDDVDRELARQEFRINPIYEDTLVGPDGKTTAVVLNIEVDEPYIELARERDALVAKQKEEGLSAGETERLEAVREEFLAYRTAAIERDNAMVEQVRQIASGYEDQADLFVGGALMITADMMAYIKSDLINFGIGILTFIIITLVVIFRDWRFVLLPLVNCVVTATLMLGLLAWLDWRMTVISSNFVLLLIIVTLALSVHLIVRFQECCRMAPRASLFKHVLVTSKAMARPCFYTVLTTIVAFVSLLVSDIRPVIDFGWMMTIGISLALLTTFVIIPAGLLLTSAQACTDLGTEQPRYTLIFSRLVENQRWVVYSLGVLLAGIATWGITRLDVENRFIDYFKSDTEIHQGMLVIDQKLGGTLSLDVVIDAPQQAVTEDQGEPAELSEEEQDLFGDDDFGSDDPFAQDDPFADDPFADDTGQSAAEAEFSYWWSRVGLDQVEELHEFLEAEPVIGKVESIANGYKVARDLTGGSLNDIEIAFMRQSLGPELEGVLLDPYLDDSINQTRISVRVQESQPGLDREELIQRIKDFVVSDLGVEAENVNLTGYIVLYNNVLQSLFASQIQTLAAVFAGIMLMFAVLFRSISISLIAMVPNALAAATVLGVMGLAGIPLDIMTITIAAITVGMGVDNSIHYIHRFRHELQWDGNYIAAMHRSHQTIGRALTYTAVTVIMGFSILALSNFIPSIYFGLLTSLAMAAAMLGSLTLLPALILLFKPFRSDDEEDVEEFDPEERASDILLPAP